MQPKRKWLKSYQDKLPLITCPTNLNVYFTAPEIAGKKLDRLSIGLVSLPSGLPIVADPLGHLSQYSEPYFLPVPSGEYEVVLVVVTSEESDDCDRYAAAWIRFSDAVASYYTEALVGTEDLARVKKPGDNFGFPVDTGLACICDAVTRDAFLAFRKEWEIQAGEDANFYDDYFAVLMKKNAQEHPQYQRTDGDWLNWQIPGTNYHIPIFQSGFGDGYYPVWFGFDLNSEICSLVVQFIDIEEAYSEE